MRGIDGRLEHLEKLRRLNTKPEPPDPVLASGLALLTNDELGAMEAMEQEDIDAFYATHGEPRSDADLSGEEVAAGLRELIAIHNERKKDGNVN